MKRLCWNETITWSCVSHLKRKRGLAVGGKMSGGGLARSQVLEHLCKLRSLKLLDQEPQFPPSEHSLEDWAQVVAHLLQASGWVICAPCLAPALGNSSVPTCVISGDPPPVSAATLSHLQQAEKLVHLGIWPWGDGSDWNLLKNKLSLLLAQRYFALLCPYRECPLFFGLPLSKLNYLHRKYVLP